MKRGVYYTPEPVVSYIVRSVDHVLRERFKRPLGLADPKTLILDPAAGTGTFLYTAIKLMNDTLATQGQLGTWSDYVARYLLPRVFGFELLMAPYAIAHLKLGLMLQELGYEFDSDERLGVYLTNTLEEAIQRTEILFAQFIADEANAAARIKAEEPIMVVLGNPPYSGISANASWRIWEDPKTGKRRRGMTWIGKLVQDYYKVDGQPLGERKVWLQDDYVKFIRFGQWRIARTGGGVLALITNHGYLDNPTFRGMRQQLMNAFSEIYILNLHGNVKKKEKSPDWSKDENVFDIQQGVAVGIFVRDGTEAGPARVHYADLWGTRESKYAWLAERDMATTEWAELAPASPFYLFVHQKTENAAEYERGWKVTDIMPAGTAGIVTARDHFVVAFEQDALLRRIQDLRSRKSSDDVIRAKYFSGKGSPRYPPGDSRGWKLPQARAKLRTDPKWRERFVTCLYRPFDRREMYYVSWMVDWPRPAVMRHMLAGKNVALITSRLTKGETFKHAQVTRDIAEVICMSPKTSNNGFLFPLYIYPERDQHGKTKRAEVLETSPWPAGRNGRRPNLNPALVEEVERRLGHSFVPDGRGDLQTTFGPEDLFYYIYAVLHSPSYRERYAEFLKMDFPRVPLTSDKRLFAKLAEKGRELVALHLMESPALDQVVAKFPVGDSNEVEKVRYSDAEKRVYINKTQYFDGVAPEVWGFHIGGYRVCEKWLKDRKGRKISYADMAHYQKMVVAIKETIRLMTEIDAVIPGWPIE